MGKMGEILIPHLNGVNLVPPVDTTDINFLMT